MFNIDVADKFINFFKKKLVNSAEYQGEENLDKRILVEKAIEFVAFSKSLDWTRIKGLSQDLRAAIEEVNVVIREAKQFVDDLRTVESNLNA